MVSRNQGHSRQHRGENALARRGVTKTQKTKVTGKEEDGDGRQRHRWSGPAEPLLIDKLKPVTFDFEGRTITGYAGDTIASALYAAGIRTFTRSFKYHRPRGLLCVSGRCPNCMMSVDGRPNVRACTEQIREGMKVKHQNAWPSLEHDFYSVIDRMDRFLPVGFYYKTFINSPWQWNRVEGRIRKVTGLGNLAEEIAKAEREETSSSSDGEEGGFEHYHLDVDVAVIGGGPSGLMAAIEASSLGAKVVLVDDQSSVGGHLRYRNQVVASVEEETGEAEYNGMRGAEVARKLSQAVHARPNITVFSNATAFGVYESNLVGVTQGRRLVKLRAREIIVAAGAHEFPAIFAKNDLPGIFLGQGLQRLVNLYGVIPGSKVVVVTNNDSGLGVANTALEAGIQVSAYADSRRNVKESEGIKKLRERNVQLLLGHTIKEAKGGKRVGGVVLVELDERGVPRSGSEKAVPCDLVALSNGFETEAWLLNQAGAKTAYDEVLEEFVLGEPKPSVHACGDVTGVHDLNSAIYQGKIAGLTAALNLIGEDGRSVDLRADHARRRLEVYSRRQLEIQKAYRDRFASQKGPSIIAVNEYRDVDKLKKRFVCICEDVVVKDIAQAVFEGFDDIETLKRYSTLSMGPCQGKMCSMNSIHACAKETGRSVPQTGRTVARPPYQPIPMGALAGAELQPVKLTAMHYKHLELGAAMMDMGEWKRPHTYSTVDEEYKAVREAVGIIDVGTLGRLDVKGKDAPRLLDFVYTHIFSNLAVGKSRYGVICDDAGVILDDGTVTRLGENHFFVTTTTGNVEFVEQWLSWWAAALRLDAHVTNVTAGLAAVNVAGPRARGLLRKLTQLDLSTEAFPYMTAAQGTVAGVPCILLRIGFVGETGWEIHFPAEFGEYFWDSLMDAGKEFGVRAFGVETQRVLRLEKKHVIVGQDTDALTNPFEADMAWIVKLEKPDFVGKAALQEAQRRGVERKLVGFVMKDSVVPHDGDQVFSEDGSKLVGFVTSSRFSPANGKGVGMAMVPIDTSKENTRIKVKTTQGLAEATLVSAAFYDPEGKRLRS